MRPLRKIALAYDDTLRTRPGEAAWHDEIWQTVEGVRGVLKGRGYDVPLLPVTMPLGPVSRRAARLAPDVIFNLVEGLEGNALAEAEVARHLERTGIPLTGCPAEAIEVGLDKVRTKEVLRSWGLPVPRGRVMETAEGHEDLRFPLIVKCAREDASLGLDDRSVVRTEAALRAQVARIVGEFRQPAIVEEFLEGREFNVAVVGPRPTVLPVSEIDFSSMPAGKPRFVSYDAKWSPESIEYRSTVPVCPAQIPPVQAARLLRLALRAFRLLGCRDFARVDFRCDSRGRPFILEINPNPDLSPDAGLARSAKAHGWNYEDLVENLALWAWRRHCGAGDRVASRPARLR